MIYSDNLTHIARGRHRLRSTKCATLAERMAAVSGGRLYRNRRRVTARQRQDLRDRGIVQTRRDRH